MKQKHITLNCADCKKEYEANYSNYKSRRAYGKKNFRCRECAVKKVKFFPFN